MGRSKLLALIFVSGYIVAFVPVLWARLDISRIPRSIWRYTAPHPRQLWRGGLLVAYLCRRLARSRRRRRLALQQ